MLTQCRDCSVEFDSEKNRKRCLICFAKWEQAGKPRDGNGKKPKDPGAPVKPEGLLQDYYVVYKIGPKTDEQGRDTVSRQPHKLAALTPQQKLLLEYMDSDLPRFMAQFQSLEKDHRAAQRKAQERAEAETPGRDENEGRVEELIGRLLGEMEGKPWEK